MRKSNLVFLIDCRSKALNSLEAILYREVRFPLYVYVYTVLLMFHGGVMLSSQMVTECTFVYMYVWTFIYFFQTFREGSRFKRIDNRLGWFALMVRM